VSARATVAGFAVAPIDESVAREGRVEHDVEQAALALRHDGRQARERFTKLALRIDDAHAPRPLGDQRAAVGQENQ
jgi:hypothetical protein